MPRDSNTDDTSTEQTTQTTQTEPAREHADPARDDSAAHTADGGTPAASTSDPEPEADFGIDDTMQDTGEQVVHVRGKGEAVAYLATYGTFEVYEQRGRGGGDITADTVAEILNDHYVKPDFSAANGGDGITGEDVRQMKPSVPGALLDAIIDDEIDVEMNADGSATVDTGAGGNSAGR